MGVTVYNTRLLLAIPAPLPPGGRVSILVHYGGSRLTTPLLCSLAPRLPSNWPW
jgi:hypothetical protein